MRTGLWRNSFNLFPGNSSNGTRAPRPTACRSIAGVLAALLAGAGGAGAIEPVAPSAEPVPSASSDVVILAGDYSMVMNVALEAAVTGNSLSVSTAAMDGTFSSQNLQLSGSGNFTNLLGVNTIALNSGSAASQNVSVNAAILINLGGPDAGQAIDLLGAFASAPPTTTP